MSIVQAICTSFKVELLQGVHDFTLSTGDVFKLALYTGAANLSALTTTYSATDEIADSGDYTAGGVTLTQTTPASDGTTALVSFANLSIAATITANGAMIYNSSKANRAVLVMDFGGPRFSAGGVFGITFPPQDAASAIIRIG
jgi:hypothetical protein